MQLSSCSACSSMAHVGRECVNIQKVAHCQHQVHLVPGAGGFYKQNPPTARAGLKAPLHHTVNLAYNASAVPNSSHIHTNPFPQLWRWFQLQLARL